MEKSEVTFYFNYGLLLKVQLLQLLNNSVKKKKVILEFITLVMRERERSHKNLKVKDFFLSTQYFEKFSPQILSGIILKCDSGCRND